MKTEKEILAECMEYGLGDNIAGCKESEIYEAMRMYAQQQKEELLNEIMELLVKLMYRP